MPNDRSFLGRGWVFPPAFGRGGREVETVSGPDDVHQSLQILFATQPGERAMQEKFGCDLNSFLFEEVGQSLVNSLTDMISDAILYYEPRIKMDRLEIDRSKSEPGLLLISIEYIIKSTNSRYNMVYPFYINEASNPGLLAR